MTKPVAYTRGFINSEETKYQYGHQLQTFFQSLDLPGSNDNNIEQGRAFLDKAKSDEDWAQESIMQYLNYHKDRVKNKKRDLASKCVEYIIKWNIKK